LIERSTAAVIKIRRPGPKNNLAAADAGKWKNEADFLLFVSDRRKPENKEP